MAVFASLPRAAITPAGQWAAASALECHSCALISGGKMTCWGRNDYGQLGDGTNLPKGPISVTGFGG